MGAGWVGCRSSCMEGLWICGGPEAFWRPGLGGCASASAPPLSMMTKLTDAVAQLYTKQSVMAFKLGAIASGIAAVAVLLAQYLFRMVTE